MTSWQSSGRHTVACCLHISIGEGGRLLLYILLTNLVFIIWTGVWIEIFTECIGAVDSDDLKYKFK